MTPQETVPDLPVGVRESLAEAWVGSGLLQVGGTECSRVPFFFYFKFSKKFLLLIYFDCAVSLWQ